MKKIKGDQGCYNCKKMNTKKCPILKSGYIPYKDDWCSGYVKKKT